MGLEGWISSLGQHAPLSSRVELLLVAFMMFLGWRSCVLAALRVGDLEWLPARECVAVVRRADKTLAADRDRPRAYVGFPRVP